MAKYIAHDHNKQYHCNRHFHFILVHCFPFLRSSDCCVSRGFRLVSALSADSILVLAQKSKRPRPNRVGKGRYPEKQPSTRPLRSKPLQRSKTNRTACPP